MPTVEELRAARAAEDARWKEFVLGLEGEFYSWDVWWKIRDTLDRWTRKQFITRVKIVLQAMEKEGLLVSRLVLPEEHGSSLLIRRYYRRAALA